MRKSLEEIHHTIPVLRDFSKWKKYLAFAGPGFLIAVGYMDPGNWATDLAGGSRFGYTLLSVVLLSGLMAMLLQYLSLKLGIVKGRDLAQASHDAYPVWVSRVLWIMAEIAITACDLAEVIGSAIALFLLFHLPIVIGVAITALDTLLLLYLQHKGLRYLEALVITLIGVIITSFIIEIILSHPPLAPILIGFIPSPALISNRDLLYIGIGILGATVMPHNLYLHSALVQSRDFGGGNKNKASAIRYATLDSNIALVFATLVNAAILIVASAVFFFHGTGEVAGIQEAYKLLTPLLGTTFASLIFAVALLASGHNSTITGTLAGQVVMEGFVDIHLPPWQRRLITRLLAIIPALIIVILYGTHGLANLLVFSQVVLSMQLPFAVVPLVMFTSSKKYMGQFANSLLVTITSWVVTGAIIFFNLWLILQSLGGI